MFLKNIQLLLFWGKMKNDSLSLLLWQENFQCIALHKKVYNIICWSNVNNKTCIWFCRMVVEVHLRSRCRAEHCIIGDKTKRDSRTSAIAALNAQIWWTTGNRPHWETEKRSRGRRELNPRRGVPNLDFIKDLRSLRLRLSFPC